jgi:hypothetical protein
MVHWSIDLLTNENIEKTIYWAFDDEDGVTYVSANGKSQFHGMRVFDIISPSFSNSYFLIEIDGNKKYIHKQTACWLLTDGKAT